ncbi:hypothetical protein [Bradyrhizobium sp. STM 3562]|uniref:hypothetical protein n=1 Tax=Bradyrhizobium sp. STM 3562 TaxID=578924 RepID=UPI0038910761
MSQLLVQEMADAVPAFRFERSNVVRLVIAQALAGANSTVIYATGAVVGDMGAVRGDGGRGLRRRDRAAARSWRLRDHFAAMQRPDVDVLGRAEGLGLPNDLIGSLD